MYDNVPTEVQTTPASDSTRWLTHDEQQSWRAILRGMSTLTAGMDADLVSHGISLPEYEILALLSESEGRLMRMSTLADGVSQSRSRLTHTANRLESRAFVKRKRVPGDGRGVALYLTDEGMAELTRLAPVHVESVRARLLDLLGADEFRSLGAMMRAVVDGAPTESAGELPSESAGESAAPASRED